MIHEAPSKLRIKNVFKPITEDWSDFSEKTLRKHKKFKLKLLTCRIGHTLGGLLQTHLQ